MPEVVEPQPCSFLPQSKLYSSLLLVVAGAISKVHRMGVGKDSWFAWDHLGFNIISPTSGKPLRPR